MRTTATGSVRADLLHQCRTDIYFRLTAIFAGICFSAFPGDGNVLRPRPDASAPADDARPPHSRRRPAQGRRLEVIVLRQRLGSCGKMVDGSLDNRKSQAR